MSITDYQLRLSASYTPAVSFDLARFRTLLRIERKRRVGGRDKLALRAKVNKSTVQNAEQGPDIPGIDTIAKLVEAMPDLTLSEFFRRVEAEKGKEGDSLSLSASGDVDKVSSSPTGGTHGRGPVSSIAAGITSRDTLRALQVAVTEALALLDDAAGEGRDHQHRVSRARPRAPRTAR